MGTKGQKQEKYLTPRKKHPVGKRSFNTIITNVTDDVYFFECACGNTFQRTIRIAHDRLPVSCKECAKKQAIFSGSATSNNVRADMKRANTPEEDSMIEAFLNKKEA